MNDTGYTACFNPATGAPLGQVALNNASDIQHAVDRARTAQPAWARLPVSYRVRHLRRVRNHLADNADAVAEIIAGDNGKTRLDAMATEVLPAAMAVDYYCRNAGRFLKDRRVRPGNIMLANKSSVIHRVPFGVIGIISPWNYPFGIPFSEVVMALLAGNAVVLKVASETQLVGRALNTCIAAAQLPRGVFTQLNVPGRLAGSAMLEAGIDKLFFTGSTAVGKALMAQAAHRLIPVNLELGGNDPMLVCPDADPDRAAAGAVWAGLQNAGQSCGGVERVYVHHRIYNVFLEALSRRVRRLRVGYDSDHRVDIGSMTTDSQLAEVRRQVDAAIAAGARIHARSSMPLPVKGRFLQAMVITGVDHSMDIMRLETFGPVLAVMPVDTMDKAVELANDSNLGLTASIWTRDRRKGMRLARRLQAGTVTINDHLVSHGMAETPWGGFKESGIGRTHGALGFAEMTQAQCLVTDWMPGVKQNLWWHPHSPRTYAGLRGMLDCLYGRRLWRRLRGLMALLRVAPRIFRKDR